jgi:hypothetical protein
MQSNHITKLITERRLAELSPLEMRSIESHISECAQCSQTYQAARVMEELLYKRAAKTFAPTPFFSKRVMALVKAQEQAQAQPALVTIWQNAWALFSGMVLVVLLLLALDINNLSFTDTAATGNPIDKAILEDNNIYAETSLTDGQLLKAVFDSEEDYGDY